MQRYFLPEQTATDTPLVLPATVAHHLVTVLRAQVGTALEVVLADHQASSRVSPAGDHHADGPGDQPG